MSRCTSSKEGNYNFFEKIDKYIEAENSADSTTPPPKTSSECNYFSTLGYNSENPSLAKEICEKFVKRYKSLNPTLTVTKKDLNYTYNWAFLNYWLNYELNKSSFYKNTCVSNFYQGMESYVQDILKYGVLMDDEIFDINKDELDKIHILFNIYSNYQGIINNGEIVCKNENICLDYYRKCFQEYKNGIIMCPKYDTDFCKELEKFQEKYEKIKNPEPRTNIYDYNIIKPLPSHEEALQEYLSELKRKKITIATISVICSMFGIILILFCLYKVQIN